MEKVRILEVKQSVFANNDAQAEKLREELKQKGIYLLNLMSSPGSGKTIFYYSIVECCIKHYWTSGLFEHTF